jgi:trimeric autotransporter adhesin
MFVVGHTAPVGKLKIGCLAAMRTGSESGERIVGVSPVVNARFSHLSQMSSRLLSIRARPPGGLSRREIAGFPSRPYTYRKSAGRNNRNNNNKDRKWTLQVHLCGEDLREQGQVPLRESSGYRSSYWLTSLLIVGCLMCATWAHAGEHHGQILSNHLPVPGAVVTAARSDEKFVVVSDTNGIYSFLNLADGTWKITVQMPFFVTAEQNVMVGPGAQPLQWELKMLPIAQALAQAKVATPRLTGQTSTPAAEQATTGATAPQPSTEVTSQSEPAPADSTEEGLLVNGSVNNAATSPFSLNQAFGNTRTNSHSLYNGGVGIISGSSLLDARPYSLSGLNTPQPSYSQTIATASLMGPLNIPHLLPRGPNFGLTYQWTRNNDALVETGLTPTFQQREDTVTTVNPVAHALLALYPVPNVVGNSTYNYQVPVLNGTHSDAFDAHLGKYIGGFNLSGELGFLDTRADQTNLFGFRDTTDSLGLNGKIQTDRRLTHNLWMHLNYNYSRLRTQVTPYFENRINISGDAGMTGNNQSPENWGPPTLVFSSGIASLTDANSSFDRNQTSGLGGSLEWSHRHHNVTVGGDFRRQEFNYFSQANPRGTFTFTGQALGSDLGDFLDGVPDTAAIVVGNPDKYLRQSVYDVYARDEWHLEPDMTINVGVRWEYGAPITELKNRLANINVAPDFTSAATVTATDPVGPVTGQRYPASLLRSDRSDVEPRIGFSWRPLPGSSLVVHAGYGIYADTSLYNNLALSMAQQAPFSLSVSASNSICPQSLKTGPNPCTSLTSDTFGIDPNFRVGYAQVWQLSLQRDLAAALQVSATYQGVRGSNGMQEFLPNTYPLGGTNPCPSCPSGFAYSTSSGNSTREAGILLLRRRLRSGLTASLQYTWSKSIDDDSILGGQGPLAAGASSAVATPQSIAQNWRDPAAERSLSTFDQRNLLNATLQYTTGMGIGGGTLSRGWVGRVYKEWTVLNVITFGSGLPETPVYLAAVSGTGFSGSIRPNRTSASIYRPPPGRYLNPAAYTSPPVGQWGNAGRNSISGPGVFTFDSSLVRTFRPTAHTYLDISVTATNVLNHVVFTGYNTTIDPALTNPVFGLPSSARAMRSLQIHARLRF